MAKKKTTREDRAKNMDTVIVTIKVDQLGQFKKGEEIVMHRSTAEACVKSGAVELKTKAKAK